MSAGQEGRQRGVGSDRRLRHALLAPDLGPSGPPYLPVVGELYLVRTLLYSSTDPAAARRAVVVSVPSSDVITYQAESDIVTYRAETVGDHWNIPTLQVRYYGKNDPADSDPYVAVCSQCGIQLDMEIEEL